MNVSIDDKYRIRVLDIEKFLHTEQLSDACASFVSSMYRRSNCYEVMAHYAQKIKSLASLSAVL